MPDIGERTRGTESFSRTKSERNVLLVAKGVGVVFAGKIFGAAHRFALAILLARILGPDQFGLYNLTLTAVNVVSPFAQLGLDTGLVRYVATYSNRRDTSSLWGILQVGIGIPTVASILIGIGLTIYAHPIAVQVFEEPRLTPLLQMAGLLVPFDAVTDVISAATRGFKNQHYTVIAKFVVQPILRTIALVILAFVGLNAERAVATYIVAVIATVALLLYFLNKQFSLRRSLRPAQHHVREMLTFSLPVYLSVIITAFRTNIQTLVLGNVTTIANVGIYALANNITMLGRLIHSSITTVAMPIIAEMYDRRDKRQLERFYQLTTQWTFTLNLPLFLVLILFPERLLSIFGHNYANGAQPLVILAWSSLAATATGTNGTVLDMTGHTKLKLLNSILAAVATAGLNVLLIPPLGMMGAAIASLTSTVIVEALRLLEVFIVVRILPYNAGFLKPITAGILAVLAVTASRQFLTSHESFILAVANAGILFSVYASFILLFGLNPEERMLVARLRQRVGLM